MARTASLAGTGASPQSTPMASQTVRQQEVMGKESYRLLMAQAFPSRSASTMAMPAEAPIRLAPASIMAFALA